MGIRSNQRRENRFNSRFQNAHPPVIASSADRANCLGPRMALPCLEFGQPHQLGVFGGENLFNVSVVRVSRQKRRCPLWPEMLLGKISSPTEDALTGRIYFLSTRLLSHLVAAFGY